MGSGLDRHRREGREFAALTDRLAADLAAMTARALAAEDRLALAEVHIEEMRDDRDQARAEVQRLTAALELAEVDLATLAAIRAHDGTGPETGPSTTHSPEQATVEARDANGPQDGSGGAA
jgi:chromosome segregation ATPase